MTEQLTVTVANVTYDLSDSIAYAHLGNDGFGISPVERLTEQGPLQDGDTDVGFRLAPRPITLVLNAIGTDINTYYQKRQQLRTIFKPRTTPVLLKFTDTLGNTYAIYAHYINGLSFNSNDKGAFGPFTQKVGIVLMANNPLWFNPNQQIYTYTVGSALGTGFAFPISFPISFGSSTVNQIQTITYNGDYATSPIIEIHGPITDAVITNLTTGVVLDFTGTTIADGTYYTIDTRYNSISVTQNNGTNRIDKLVGQSDLSGFRLEASPDAVGGINSIQVTGSAANINTIIYLRYFEQFTGF